MDEVTVIETGPMDVIGTRRKGAYKDVALILPELFSHVMSAGIRMAGPPAFLCHELTMEDVEKAMKENSADLEVVIPIAGDAAEKDDLKAYTLPGGRMARILHKGPYDKVGETYARLFEWMARTGNPAKGPYREIYLNSPMEVPPSDLLTEIHVPI